MIPLLEFDENPNAKSDPFTDGFDFSMPKRCLLTFFQDVVGQWQDDSRLRIIGTDKWENGTLKYSQTKVNNTEIGVVCAWTGAPVASAILDTVIALGAEKIVACGSCGIISKSITANKLLLPTVGVRDEGTSFHYAPPTREIYSSEILNGIILEYCKTNNIPIETCKTWTTDGLFRETDDKIRKRINEKCSVVDMEFSALCAVAQLRNMSFAEIFYCGDDLSSEIYKNNDWHEQESVRGSLFEMCLEILSFS
jgi:uridine phosphorylase